MTDKSAREVIAGAVLSVCSDGNSDNNRVASDIIAALEAGGFAVVPKEPTEAMLRALSVVTVDGETRAIWMHQVRVDWSAMLAASNPKEE